MTERANRALNLSINLKSCIVLQNNGEWKTKERANKTVEKEKSKEDRKKSAVTTYPI